jgi:succinoglycan biosynthesis transport protein ExoP
MTDPSSRVDELPESEGFDLERWLRLLRRRWWVILGCVVLVAGCALAFSLARQKEYSASASLLFRNSEVGPDILGITGSPPTTDPAREAATNVTLVESPAVAVRVSKALSGHIGPGRVQKKVSVSAEGQSNVVSVEAQDRSPKVATTLANTYATEFIGFRRDADRNTIVQARDSILRQLNSLPPAQRDSPAGRSLQARVEQLNTLASLQTGNAELVQAARVPRSPSSPNTKVNVIIAGFLGLLLGVGLALLLDRLNRSVRDPNELSQVYGMPVLAEVPEAAGFMLNGRGRPMTENEREAFRMLRARLRYFNVNREVRSLLVTSGTTQEGKSTVAWHLASALAMSSRGRVLLVDADLRRPTLATTHGLEPAPGLSELLVDDSHFNNAVQRVELGTASNGTRREGSLHLIAAGSVPPNPAELMESQRMANLLEAFKAAYDFVVLDTGPTLLVADPLALMTQVDGVLIVSRVGSTTRDVSAQLRDQLRALDAPVLGVVANRVSVSALTGYGYGPGEPKD